MTTTTTAIATISTNEVDDNDDEQQQQRLMTTTNEEGEDEDDDDDIEDTPLGSNEENDDEKKKAEESSMIQQTTATTTTTPNGGGTSTNNNNKQLVVVDENDDGDNNYFIGKRKPITLDESGFVVDEPFPYVQMVMTMIGLFVGFIIMFIDIGGGDNNNNNKLMSQTIGLTIWMITLWITSIIPHVVTAFIPLILYPLFAINKASIVAKDYVNNMNWLLIVGYFISLSIQRWYIHKRIAISILSICGISTPRRLLLVMMLITYIITMFISISAIIPTIISIGIALCEYIQQQQQQQHYTNNNNNKGRCSKQKKAAQSFTTAMMLGIAYSANLGNLSSLIGSVGPNPIFSQELELTYPNAPTLTSEDWWSIGIPMSFPIFVIVWVYLSLVYVRNFNDVNKTIHPDIIQEEYKAIGLWTWEQVIIVFLSVALCILWLFQDDIPWSGYTLSGWSSIFPDPPKITDTTIGMFISFIMFITPARAEMLPDTSLIEYKGNGNNNNNNNAKPRWTTLLDWKTANKMPYDMIFLYGSGFAIANGFIQCGITATLNDKLVENRVDDDDDDDESSTTIASTTVVFIILTLCLTQIIPSTAIANIMIPIAASVSKKAAEAAAAAAVTDDNTNNNNGDGMNPYILMIAVTLACNCSFLFPVSSPANLAAYTTGYVPLVPDMYIAGMIHIIISFIVLLFITFVIIPPITGYDINEVRL